MTENHSPVPSGCRDISFHCINQTYPEALPPHMWWVPRAVSGVIKWPRIDNDHSSSSTAKVKDQCCYTSILPCYRCSQITCYLRSLTLHITVARTVWPLLGSRQNGHETLYLFQNIYSVRNMRTLFLTIKLVLLKSCFMCSFIIYFC
jgi:hypothetical protein